METFVEKDVMAFVDAVFTPSHHRREPAMD